jgi:hypothetical protein
MSSRRPTPNTLLSELFAATPLSIFVKALGEILRSRGTPARRPATHRRGHAV